jgi:hypothetical protein
LAKYGKVEHDGLCMSKVSNKVWMPE